jgi:REP element-mobilizing transposase RayT
MSTAYRISEQDAAYFLTFQIVGWVDIFTRKIYKDIVIESLSYCQQQKGLLLYAYVIMSNHIHLLVQSETGNLKPKQTNQVWTHENHAELISSPKFIEQKINYIHDNPVRSGIVANAEDYLYSSARNYAGLEDSEINVIVLDTTWKTY